MTVPGLQEYNLQVSDKETVMKISICNELFQGWPIEKVFAYAAELGYDGVKRFWQKAAHLVEEKG